MKRQLCCVLTIPWHCCICFSFWIGKWTPTMEKGHPRYLTAEIKMPPETTSVGRCLWHGVYSNNLVLRSHCLSLKCGMRLGIAYLASGLFLHSGCGKGERNFPYPVPRPHYSGRPMRFGSLSPGEEVRRFPPVRPGDITVVNWPRRPGKCRTGTRHKFPLKKRYAV